MLRSGAIRSAAGPPPSTRTCRRRCSGWSECCGVHRRAGEREWSQRIAGALEALVWALSAHRQSTQAPDGLLAELLHAMPRAQYQIGRIREDHPVLLQQATGLREDVECMGGVGVIAVDTIRHRAAELLGAIRIHMARQVDLIYEAFNTDIGTCD